MFSRAWAIAASSPRLIVWRYGYDETLSWAEVPLHGYIHAAPSRRLVVDLRPMVYRNGLMKRCNNYYVATHVRQTMGKRSTNGLVLFQQRRQKVLKDIAL